MVEKSDKELISTIVALLEKEKSLGKMQTMTNDRSSGERKHAINEKDPNNSNKKNYTKLSKNTPKNAKRRLKHKESSGKVGKVNSEGRIYKKDHLGRVLTTDNEDENLMQEDENFRENDGMAAEWKDY